MATFFLSASRLAASLLMCGEVGIQTFTVIRKVSSIERFQIAKLLCNHRWHFNSLSSSPVCNVPGICISKHRELNTI